MGILETINSRALGRNTWPDPAQREVWEEVSFFRALRQSDGIALRSHESIPWNYPYLITPVPRLISRASANMLYGEPPEIRADTEVDQERMDFIVEENGLASEAQRGAMIASSEGEVYGRIIFAPTILDAPIIEFVSRERVIPHFAGRFLIGATFVTEWEIDREVMRLFEHYEPGAIRSELFRGTRTSLGTKVDLATFDQTADVIENVVTGFDRALVVFIPNSIDADPTRGFSDYRGLEDRFLSINKSATIGHNNAEIAGRKRALIDGKYMKPDGRAPIGDDIFVNADTNKTMGEAGKPLQILEYDFDAAAIVQWIDHLLDSTLLFAGIAPQSVGRGVEGGAISGTAQRLKMSYSLIESSGKGRFFDRGLKQLLRYAAVIDARPTTENGFGRKWSSRDPGVPAVDRADALPRDEMEAAQRLVMLTTAEAVSVEERVRIAHPEWDDEQIMEEVSKLGEESTTTAPPTFADPNAIPTAKPALELKPTAAPDPSQAP